MRRLTALVVLVCFVAGFPVDGLAVMMCGADLNGDGYTDGPNETAQCQNVPVHGGQGNQDFCPVQAVDCEATTSNPTTEKTCSDPAYSYNATADRCEKTPDCPGGTWDPATKGCTGGPSIPATPVVPSTCSAEIVWDMVTTTTWTGSAPPGGTVEVWRVRLTTGGAMGYYYFRFDQACNWVDYYVVDTRTNPPSTTSMAHAGALPLAPGQRFQQTYPDFWGTGTWSVTYTNTTPPTTGYTCPAGYTLQGTSCVPQPPASDCGAGTLDTAAGLCVMPPTTTQTCPTGTLDPATGLCAGDYVCPLGDQYACLDTGGQVPQCSPNACTDIPQDQTGVDTAPQPVTDTWLRDDGPKDADGNCLGVLFIFSGKPSRCRPPGMTVGYANDCCDADGRTIADSRTGQSFTQTANALHTAYQMAQTAYYSYQIGAGAMAVSQTATGAVVITNAATGATVTTIAAGSEMASGVLAANGAAMSGAGASGAVSAGLQGYATAMLNPATIVFALVIMAVMKVAFGKGCDQNDGETALFAASGYCHYLGTVCDRKWPVVGCVQRSRRYCCFNSKMARIVAEQGRPQLKAFGPDGGWGTPGNPNCRGFTPEEFQQLDFSRIDLSEYFDDIMADMNRNVQDARQRIEQGIQQHYQRTSQ